MRFGVIGAPICVCSRCVCTDDEGNAEIIAPSRLFLFPNARPGLMNEPVCPPSVSLVSMAAASMIPRMLPAE
jgi:hypothetical protein